MTQLVLLEAAYDSPLVTELVDEVQAEYVQRYGSPDETPLSPAEFAPPGGAFFVAMVGGEAVATAGLRDHGDGDVELKRMYVRAAHRRRGHARQLLAAVEERALALGHRRIVLETGSLQPEAVALYRSAGYEPTAPFGYYACAPLSIHLAKTLAGQSPLAGPLDIGSPPPRG
ncbi:Acetyltransferase (GNAT) family protein [Quadrisphaera granulorum]|uniref:Acetyltransferase (GNAT) family protein n=1 Tax=Quadrisphaera granulorum TaxID=317664 RepID=A0A316AHL3_9ACTN|nr:GNAT family N-acetyltransferase [Quadrisphaera granulorum]PWJ56434.1 acetyltransferase (GNAT) family protein [Quadrisphaera granulorum]SZE95068.1 Acetyltransferase (GNAT) family protein [Quadrisphaera granulorum]